jgi:hypothetical protein
LGESVDRIIARFIYASVKSVGIEELALLLSRIGVVSSNKNGSRLTRRRWPTSNCVIYARVVISKFKSTSKPSPLESPISIGKVFWNRKRDIASTRTSICGSRITSVR